MLFIIYEFLTFLIDMYFYKMKCDFACIHYKTMKKLHCCTDVQIFVPMWLLHSKIEDMLIILSLHSWTVTWSFQPPNTAQDVHPINEGQLSLQWACMKWHASVAYQTSYVIIQMCIGHYNMADIVAAVYWRYCSIAQSHWFDVWIVLSMNGDKTWMPSFY